MGSPQEHRQSAPEPLAALGEEGTTPSAAPAGPSGGDAPTATPAELDGAPASKRPRLEVQPSAEQPANEQLQLMAFPAAAQPPMAVDPSWMGAEGTFRVEGCQPPSTAFITLRLGGHEWKGALICPPAAFLEPTRTASAPLKKPRTPFNFFSDAVRPSIKEQHPQADQKGISKLVGERWAQLPAEEREPYNQQARQDRERYERELRDFQNRFPQGSRRDLHRHAGPPAGRQEVTQAQQAEAPLPNSRARVMTSHDAAAAASPWAGGGGPGNPSGSLPPMPAPPPPGQLTAWLSSVAREGSMGGNGSRDTSTVQPSASGGTFPSPTLGTMLPPAQVAHVPVQAAPNVQAAMQGLQPGPQAAALHALQALLQAGGQLQQPRPPPAAVGPPQSAALTHLLSRTLGGEQAPPPAPAAPAPAAQATADLVSLLVRLAQPPGGQQAQPPPPGGR